MIRVNQVQKKEKLDKKDTIRYQLMTHCFLNKIEKISESDIDCLALLADSGEQELNEFCKKVAASGIFKTSQTARNSLMKSEKKKMVMKDGKSKKRIWLNPELKIQTQGNIMLDFKFLYLEPVTNEPGKS